jgi:hypothetical protein
MTRVFFHEIDKERDIFFPLPTCIFSSLLKLEKPCEGTSCVFVGRKMTQWILQQNKIDLYFWRNITMYVSSILLRKMITKRGQDVKFSYDGQWFLYSKTLWMYRIAHRLALFTFEQYSFSWHEMLMPSLGLQRPPYCSLFVLNYRV